MHSHSFPLFLRKHYATPMIRRKPGKFEIKFVLNLIWLYHKEWFSAYKVEFTLSKGIIMRRKTSIIFEVRTFILNYYAINCKEPVASSRKFIIWEVLSQSVLLKEPVDSVIPYSTNRRNSILRFLLNLKEIVFRLLSCFREKQKIIALYPKLYYIWKKRREGGRGRKKRKESGLFAINWYPGKDKANVL